MADGGGITDDGLLSAATPYGGMAPGARMAFFDIGLAGESFLSVPSELESSMFPFAYDMGARLHSNSWGTNLNAYNDNSYSIDQFTWDNQVRWVVSLTIHGGDATEHDAAPRDDAAVRRAETIDGSVVRWIGRSDPAGAWSWAGIHKTRARCVVCLRTTWWFVIVTDRVAPPPWPDAATAAAG